MGLIRYSVHPIQGPVECYYEGTQAILTHIAIHYALFNLDISDS